MYSACHPISEARPCLLLSGEEEKTQEVKLYINKRKKYLPAHCKQLVETLKQGPN